jgi:hypothetical protein
MPLIQAIIGGGLGNKLFGYCFARAYAEKYGCELHVQGGLYPQKWNIIFEDTDHPPVTRDLPIRQSFDFEKWDGETDITIQGFCQHQKNLIYTRRQVKEWLRFKPDILDMVKGISSVEILCNQRLGDYCLPCNPFAWVSQESYVKCCWDFGLDPNKITWQDGDTHYPWPGIDASLFKHHEHHAEFDERIDFLPDFVVMMRAKNLIRANSTFGWWAHELGDNDRVFSPNVYAVNANDGLRDGARHPQFVPFVEGNHMPAVAGYEQHSLLYLLP